MTTPAHRNRLADETSPYLLQHADNPVDWHPWAPDALAKAEREDKPILLSIGYSACHWCHVMAHESFEHQATAALMNRLFVNIKVDREERPDLDKIYQLAQQILSRRTGGWPLTMFLTPGNLVPFYGGTYFPREPRYGMPAFSEVLQRISEFYREQREALENQNAELVKLFESLNRQTPASGNPDASVLDMARHQLEHEFDPQHGGFGRAPKFPHPPNIARLMRHHAAMLCNGGDDARAQHMALFSLERMALGGIYDQLGGGFCRYSVDARWEIPHFEKMLYDNALLLPQYADAALLSSNPLFKRIALETAAWVMREMQSPDGGYYSSLDADSEGEEGRFYVWTTDEVRSLLTEDEYRVFASGFGLDRPANFEGRWHLQAVRNAAEVAVDTGLDEAEVQRHFAEARRRLFQVRERRTYPGRDDKILTSWNALMIRGMMITARELDNVELRHSADRALEFIRATLWKEGRLLATCKDGKAHLPAYLDDYAFLLDAVLESVQTRWNSSDLEFAVRLADAMLEHFEDSVQGGFFFTAHDHEMLIHRPKPFSDDSLPAGNGVAARALQRLGHLLGESRYIDAGARTLQAAWQQISELPYAHNTLLDALEEHLQPPRIVVLRGEQAVLDKWLKACHESYAPDRLTIAIPADAGALPGLLAERPAPDHGALGYVCSGTACQAPVDDLDALRQALGRNPAQ